MNFIEWELAQYGDLPDDDMPDPVAIRAEKYAEARNRELVDKAKRDSLAVHIQQQILVGQRDALEERNQELAAALKTCLHITRMSAAIHEHLGKDCPWCAAIDNAKAALAKNRGGQ